MDKNFVLNEIEKIRKKLYLFSKQQNYSNLKLVELSQQLDEKILEFQKLFPNM